MTYAHLGDTRPRARNRHQCYLCGKPIEPGWVYVRRAGVCDGEFSSTPMHVACEEISKSWDEMDWECYSPVDGPWPEYDAEGNVIGGVSRDGKPIEARV